MATQPKSIVKRLAEMIGVRTDQVDDALKNEDRARRQLSRRGFLAAGAALCAGPLLPEANRIYSLPAPRYRSPWPQNVSPELRNLVMGAVLLNPLMAYALAAQGR